MTSQSIKPAIRLFILGIAAGAGGAAAQTGGEQQLPEVKVTAPTPAETAISPVQGYVAERSATATKTDTPIIETPQSISVITRDRIVDQGAQTIQDALRYSAGVRSDAFGLDSRGDWAFIRGTDFTQYQDGLRLLFDFYNNVRPDPYALERIEILRGPASVLFGQGSVGGVINLISKRPQPEAGREVEAQLGNYGRRQIAADFTGPLTEDGDWLYRLVVLGRDADTQVDFVEDDRAFVAPSLTWQPSAATRWTFLFNFQRDRSGSSTAFLPWSGTVLPNPNGRIPTSRFVSEPGFDRYDTDQEAYGWQFEHQANETWTLRQNLRYTESEADYRTLYPDVFSNPSNPFVDPNQRQVFRFSYVSQPEARAFVVDNQAQARFATGALDHTLLLGLDYSRVRIDGRTGFGFEATPFDLFAPVYGNNFVPPATADDPESSARQTGFYVQDQIALGPRWRLLLGLRHDTATNAVEGGERLEDDAVTKRAGLLYLTDSGLAPYVSYTESFLPIAFTDFFTRPYDPLEGKQYEVGVKYQPPGSRTLITAALYDLREENRLTPDPNNPFNEIQLGEARVKGLELEAVASPMRNLDLIATYSYTDTEATDAGGGPDQVLAGVPEHLASAWGVYRFAIGDLPGFQAGAGVRYIGESTDETGNIKVPSETLLDAMLAYERGPWRFALNAANLTDEEVIATCLARGDCFYGSRRTVVFTTRYRF